MGILTTATGFLGSKFGLYAIIGSSLIIAGMYGYIKYTAAQTAKTEIKLRSDLKDAKRDVKEQKRVIEVQQQEARQVEWRMVKINASLATMQRQFVVNAQTKRKDINGLIAPRPQPGDLIDLAAITEQANMGMNKLFDDMMAISQPTPAPTPVAPATEEKK